MRFIHRCGISILAAGLLFVCVNFFYFWRYGDCNDCAVKLGVPFPFWQSEGFATASRFLWPGVKEDFAFVLAIAVVAIFAWSAFGPKNSK
jgi:hypothetical protein